MKADVVKGEIKCPRCGAINKLNFRQGQEPIGCTKIEKIKCNKCGRTLMKADVVKGEIKCPRCGAINKLNFRQGQEPIGCTKE